MSFSSREYEHSGSVGLSPLTVLLVGIVASLVLSVAYAYITVYSPVGGYVSILFVVGFGFGVGLAGAFAVRAGKCRNRMFATMSGLLLGLFALYSAWVLFLFVLLRRSGLPLEWVNLPKMFLSPVAVWHFALAINETGWFEIGKSTPTGAVLWVFWAIEAILIVGMISFITRAAIEGEVFCERCHAWISDALTLRLSLAGREDAIAGVTEGNLADLASLPPAAEGEYPHLRIDVKSCESCESTATYQVKLARLETDKDGKTKEVTSDVTKILLLSAEQLEELKQLAERPVPEAQPEDETEVDAGESGDDEVDGRVDDAE